jgi:hypothetical protein
MGRLRVRHHTDDAGLRNIRAAGAIRSSRGWGTIASGVHVEVEPFGSTAPSRPGRPGPRSDLGCEKDGAYVEFDAPEGLIRYVCGPRNSGIIPVPAEEILSLAGLNPMFVWVRRHWWQLWRTRTKPE